MIKLFEQINSPAVFFACEKMSSHFSDRQSFAKFPNNIDNKLQPFSFILEQFNLLTPTLFYSLSYIQPAVTFRICLFILSLGTFVIWHYRKYMRRQYLTAS